MQVQLSAGYYSSSRQNAFLILGYKLDIEIDIAVSVLLQCRTYLCHGYAHPGCLLGGQVQEIGTVIAAFNTVGNKVYLHGDILADAEEVLVIYADFTGFFVKSPYPIVLISVLHLVGMWIKSAVRCQNAVTVKIMVAGRILSIIATVHPYLPSCLLALSPYSLVY